MKAFKLYIQNSPFKKIKASSSKAFKDGLFSGHVYKEMDES